MSIIHHFDLKIESKRFRVRERYYDTGKYRGIREEKRNPPREDGPYQGERKDTER